MCIVKKQDMQQTYTSLFIIQPHLLQSISHISVTSRIITHLQNHNEGGTKKVADFIWILRKGFLVHYCFSFNHSLCTTNVAKYLCGLTQHSTLLFCFGISTQMQNIDVSFTYLSFFGSNPLSVFSQRWKNTRRHPYGGRDWRLSSRFGRNHGKIKKRNFFSETLNCACLGRTLYNGTQWRQQRPYKQDPFWEELILCYLQYFVPWYRGQWIRNDKDSFWSS